MRHNKLGILKRIQKDSFFKLSGFFVLLSLVSAALNYAYYPLIARLLVPSEFGTAQVLIAILLQISAVFSGLNLVVVFLIRRLGEKKASEIVEILQKITSLVFLILTVVIVILQNSIMHFLHIDNRVYLFIVAVDLFANIPFILTFGYLQAQKRFIAAGLLQLSVVTTKLVAGGFATAQLGISGALLGFAIGQILGMGIFWTACKLMKKQAWNHNVIQSFSFPRRKDLIFLKTHGLHIASIFTVNVLLVTFISLDIIASRHYFSAQLSGLYAGASTLSNSIIFACLPLISVLLPHLSIKGVKESRSQLLKTTGMILGAGGIATLLFYIFSSSLLGIFGSEYIVMKDILWKLGILMTFLSLNTLFLQVNAFYRPIRSAAICTAGLVLTVTLVSLSHSSPSALVSTIMISFAIITLISLFETWSNYAKKTT